MQQFNFLTDVKLMSDATTSTKYKYIQSQVMKDQHYVG